MLLRYRLCYGKTLLHGTAFLKESEYWSKEKLDAFQLEQLKRNLIRAGQNVPYYKNIFDEYGFDPKKLQCIDDIKFCPILQRRLLETMYIQKRYLIDKG